MSPQALQYVKNYAEGSSQWEGFPIEAKLAILSKYRIVMKIQLFSRSHLWPPGGRDQIADFARQQRIGRVGLFSFFGVFVWYTYSKQAVIFFLLSLNFKCNSTLNFRSGTINTLAQETVNQGLLGIMVWFCRFDEMIKTSSAQALNEMENLLSRVTYW